MAELCGPSNPVQKFQQHTSTDRSLQHDRLTSNRTPAEQFKNAPNPADVNLIEAEFAAFENSRPPDPSYIDPHPLQRFPLQPASSSHNPQADWASDFQNLQLQEANASPIPSSHFHHLAPLQRNHADPWRSEFSRLQGGNAGQTAAATPTSDQRQWHTLPSHQHQAFITSPGLPTGVNVQQQQQQQQQSQFAPQIDEEAFARAFEQAELDLHTQREENVDVLPESEPEPVITGVKIGSDLIAKPEPSESHPRNRSLEADELARTAGHLLESVRDDRSAKFQQSSFMSLMRQLRDREVEVEGDRIVETAQPLHPGGANYPSPPRFGAPETRGDIVALTEVEEPPSLQGALPT